MTLVPYSGKGSNESSLTKEERRQCEDFGSTMDALSMQIRSIAGKHKDLEMHREFWSCLADFKKYMMRFRRMIAPWIDCKKKEAREILGEMMGIQNVEEEFDKLISPCKSLSSDTIKPIEENVSGATKKPEREHSTDSGSGVLNFCKSALLHIVSAALNTGAEWTTNKITSKLSETFTSYRGAAARVGNSVVSFICGGLANVCVTLFGGFLGCSSAPRPLIQW